ncbi:MAG: universal stress protein [Gammaproteobacteria bacterium]|nr:universal stress protein [Gammaproteobacteria bacterium]
MKNILVHADLGKSFRMRMEYAAALAGRNGARIDALYVIPLFEMPGNSRYSMPKAVLEERSQAEHAEAESAKAIFDEVVAATGVEARWTIEVGDYVETLCGFARTSDLLLMGQRNAADLKVSDSPPPDRIILRAGRPVLVTPHVKFDQNAGSHILLAWDGSRESARAMHDAMPLLLAADEVDVVTFAENKSAAAKFASMESAVNFLSENGVKAKGESLVLSQISVGESLLNRVVDRGANMLVMGGYGQSRLREIVLGGVTRTVLEHMSVPVLMSR